MSNRPVLLSRLSITLIAFCSAFAIAIALFQMHQTLGAPATGDFKRIWAAVGLFASGGNPYDAAAVSQYAVTHGAGETDTLPMYYPPLAFSTALPLAFISFDTARLGYLALVATLFFSVWIAPSLSALRRGTQPNARSLAVLRLAGYLTFLPAFLLWWVGVFSVVPLLGLLVALKILTRRESTRHAKAEDLLLGAAVTLTLAKPNICPLVLPFLVVTLLRNRQLYPLLGLLAGIVALTLPLFWSDLSLQKIATATNFASSMNWSTPSLSRTIQSALDLGDWVRWGVWLLGLTVAVALGLRARREDTAKLLVAVILPLGVLVSPFIWTYDFAILIFSVAYVLNGSLSTTRSVRELVPAATVLFFNALLCVVPLVMELHWFYPIGIGVAAVLLHILQSNKEAGREQ